MLSTSSFNVAIPALGEYFGLSQGNVQWAITGFMAAMTLSMLPAAWLLDRFGFRYCLLGALMLLLISSIAGALSMNFTFLVTARILQGVAAGVLQPLGAVVVMSLFPVNQQGKASGILGFGIVLAPAVAPMLGGMLLDSFGWQSIFLINLPFCLLASVGGYILIPGDKSYANNRFDWFGAGLLCFSTIAAIEGISSVHSSGPIAPRTLLFLGMTVCALLFFIRHARRATNPLVELGLFADRAFSMGAIVSVTYGFGLYASTYLIPVFLQRALGYSATQAGLAMLPAGVTLAVVIPLGGRLADHISPHLVTFGGLALFGVSFLLLAILGAHISFGELVWSTVLGRIGLALILPALGLAALRGMGINQLGQSSVVISYMRQFGGVLGVAVSAVFVEWRESVYRSEGADIAGAYVDSFTLLVAIFVVALTAAGRMKHHVS
ncbi:DHA2 family efflux MFS transporter permease subunit [Ferribacterium limneticum]|nr:DHA2 family efflux MFS transporter permease subunit [Ferribacterium limneticum]